MGTDNMGNLGIGEKIIFQWILGKYGRFLWTQWWTFEFHNREFHDQLSNYELLKKDPVP
jgi:hypothetical protein